MNIKIKTKREHEIWADGYMLGFFTAFDMIIKYCYDMKEAYKKVEKMTAGVKNERNKKRL